MIKVNLSEAYKTVLGEMGLDNCQQFRVAGAKDLHPTISLGGNILPLFREQKIELYFVVDDEEYILINDIEPDYQVPMK